MLLGDVHAAACGIKIEGLRPFDASQVFFDSLRGCREAVPQIYVLRLLISSNSASKFISCMRLAFSGARDTSRRQMAA